MKIDGNQLGGAAPEPNIQKPGPAAAGSPQTAGVSSTRRAAKQGYGNSADAPAGASLASDRVTLSDLGKELSRLGLADEAARETRIEKLAAEYTLDQLEIDAGQVANKMVDDAFHNE